MDLKGAVVIKEHNQDSWLCGNISNIDGSIEVVWNSGKVENYTESTGNLLVYDLGPTGICHENVTCDGCSQTNIIGIRWKCHVCPDYDLCSSCYNKNIHKMEHSFKRIDFPNATPVILSQRKHEKSKKVYGFFPGARVKRGKDWEWGGQDGGAGNLGSVVDLYNWKLPFGVKTLNTERSGVMIKWDVSQNTNNYRAGFQGKVDLQCESHAYGGMFYPTHLGTTKALLQVAPKQITEKKLNVGDLVVIYKSIETLAELQTDHGGFVADMVKCVGIVGSVVEMIRGNAVVAFAVETQSRDLLMALLDINIKRTQRWVVNSAALQKVESLQENDKVKVIDDVDTLIIMQKNLGSYKPLYNQLCGKEGIIQKNTGKLLLVKFGGEHVFPMSCGAVTKVNEKSSQDELLGLLLEGFVKAVIDERKGKEQQQDQQQKQIRGEDEEKKDDDLRALVSANDKEGVKKLLNDRPHLANIFQYGSTSLHVAVFNNYTEIVDIILKAGCDPSIPDDNGDTVLHVAASKDFVKTGKKLIAYKCPKNWKNKSGLTALTIATYRGHENFVSMLVAEGCATNIMDPNGNIPLHTACSEGKDGLVDFLINEEDIAVANRDGHCGIHLAIAKGHLDVVNLISINYPEVLNIEKEDGTTPLHYAARNGREEIVEHLLKVSAKKKFNIDRLAKSKQNALHIACVEGYLSIVKLLLNHGATIDAESHNGNTAVHLCVIKHQLLFNLPQQLQEYQLRPDLKTVNSHFGNRVASGIIIACYLVENGASLDYINHEGKTVLDVCEDSVLTKLLCEFGKKHRALQSASPTPYHSVTPTKRQTRQCFKTQESELDFDPCPLCEKRTPVEGRFQPCGHAMFCYEHADTFKNCPNCKMPVRELTSLSIERLPNCMFCQEIRVNITFQPCGHQIACYDCCKRFKACLKCDVTIQAKVPIGNFQIEVPTTPTSSAAAAAATAASMENDSNERNICNICFERARNVVFQCGHNSCKVCAYVLKECHICRVKITQRIFVFDN